MIEFKKGNIVGFRASKAEYHIGVIDKIYNDAYQNSRASVNVVCKKTFVGIMREKSVGNPLVKDLMDEQKSLDLHPEWFV